MGASMFDIGVNLTSSQFAKDRDDVVARAFADAPRDKCAHFREINGITAAFHYLQKNYNPIASFFL